MCLPVAARLPTFSVEGQLSQGDATAWQLQAHAAALQLVLMETLLQDAQPPASKVGEHDVGVVCVAVRGSSLCFCCDLCLAT